MNCTVNMSRRHETCNRECLYNKCICWKVTLLPLACWGSLWHSKEWFLSHFPNNAIHSWKQTTEKLNKTKMVIIKENGPLWKGRNHVILAMSLKDLSSWKHHDVWENMSSRSESSCPNENEVDDAAAPVSIATPDELKNPSPIVNRLRPRLRPKKYSGIHRCWVHPQY